MGDDLTRENCGEQYGFYNNFFVADIDRFMQPDIQRFLHYVDKSGKIFTNRWNDLILQSSTVQFFINKNATFHFTGWTYGHNSGYHDMLLWYCSSRPICRGTLEGLSVLHRE